MSNRVGNQSSPAPSALSRRTLLKRTVGAGAAVAAGGLLGACGSGGTASSQSTTSKTLVFAGYGGTAEDQLRRAVFDDFEEETGITVQVTTGAYTAAKLKAMVDANRVEWDVVRVFGGSLGENIRLGVLEEIDYSAMEIPPVVTDQAMSPYAVNYNQFAHAIFWNTDLMDRPNDWKDVFDVEKLPGLRGWSDSPFFSPEAAMLASGRSKDDVYPIDIDLYLEMLDSIRSSSRFLGAEPLTSLIADGGVATGDINRNRLISAIDAGVPIEYHWNEALTDLSGLSITKGAPNEDAAYKLLEYFMRPEVQQRIYEVLPTNSPVAEEAFETITQEDQENMAGSQVTVDQAVYLDPEWYAEHGQEIGERFSKWLRDG